MAVDSFYRSIRDAVIAGDKKKAEELAREAVRLGYDLKEVVDKGYTPGIQHVGDLWAWGEYFLPELLRCTESMKAAMSILQKEMSVTQAESISRGRVVIGTVEGDVHDIGKNLVATLLQANGFEILDLGVSVRPAKFIEKAEATGARIICLSALLTTTMINQKKFIAILRENGLRGKYKVMVGGAPTSRRWADEIGADGYAENAAAAVDAALALADQNQ